MSIKEQWKKLKDTVYGKKYNEKGEELMDPTPIAIPAGYRRPPTLQEQMARYMAGANLLAQQQGSESFEEADDFDIGDDYDPYSPHELAYDQELGKEMPQEVKRQLDQDRAQFDEYHKKKRQQSKKFQEEKPKPRKKKEEESEED